MEIITPPELEGDRIFSVPKHYKDKYRLPLPERAASYDSSDNDVPLSNIIKNANRPRAHFKEPLPIGAVEPPAELAPLTENGIDTHEKNFIGDKVPIQPPYESPYEPGSDHNDTRSGSMREESLGEDITSPEKLEDIVDEIMVVAKKKIKLNTKTDQTLFDWQTKNKCNSVFGKPKSNCGARSEISHIFNSAVAEVSGDQRYSISPQKMSAEFRKWEAERPEEVYGRDTKKESFFSRAKSDAIALAKNPYLYMLKPEIRNRALPDYEYYRKTALLGGIIQASILIIIITIILIVSLK